MATNTAVRRRTRAPAAPRLSKRVTLEYVDLNDIVPYPDNPRDNEKAIPQVAESIRNFGFLVPCVIDKDNVLVAGHTRVEAAKLLGMTEVPCVRAQDLTPEYINAFRLADNKVAEGADWNFDLLSSELSKLTDLGIDFTLLGWDQETLDCLSEIVSSDCLETSQVAASDVVGGTHDRRAPTRVRAVIGEVVFFFPATIYNTWVAGIRELCAYDETAITNELKRRLGILE